MLRLCKMVTSILLVAFLCHRLQWSKLPCWEGVRGKGQGWTPANSQLGTEALEAVTPVNHHLSELRMGPFSVFRWNLNPRRHHDSSQPEVLKRGPSSATPELRTHGNYEVRNVCCFAMFWGNLWGRKRKLIHLDRRILKITKKIIYLCLTLSSTKNGYTFNMI